MHKNGVLPCTTCELKLEEADPILVGWFWNMKLKYPDLHVAWSYRGEADQHADFLSGKSKLDYPNSKHNNTVNGKPSSLALDVFTLDSAGVAHFNPDFYEQLNEDTIAEGYKITWGGSWQTFKDLDHYQIADDQPVA